MCLLSATPDVCFTLFCHDVFRNVLPSQAAHHHQNIPLGTAEVFMLKAVSVHLSIYAGNVTVFVHYSDPRASLN